MRAPETEWAYKSELIHEEASNITIGYKLAKRTIDILGSLIGLFILFLVMLPMSVFYLLGNNRGSIFFKQERIGQGGKIFYIYKFRSMIRNAEEVLKKDSKLYEKYVASSYKLEPEEDPRITAFGRFIRKTSLDELPQFFNVLKGDMSLVGPRPVVQVELDEYGEKKDKFLSVKPGITGHWQTCGRSNINYPERVNIELYYMYNQTFLFDLKILFKTIVQVLLRKGAY
ncbi:MULTISPECIES: sugar transferase [unclassified Planococcus (in: firmicutes)]|uniref:sugar transferase n=1 Tax=unclassified Planococcus (in: firmicutes) TaxID=2662419 RepID=UPI0015E0F553|nr:MULTISPECIES: sugar transferase [unclassified Planococcus (in: firmicutes)]